MQSLPRRRQFEAGEQRNGPDDRAGQDAHHAANDHVSLELCRDVRPGLQQRIRPISLLLMRSIFRCAISTSSRPSTREDERDDDWE